MDRELLEQISEQLATALCAEDLVDRLEWNVLIQLGIEIGVTDAPDLGSSNDRQQVEIIERSGRLGKTSHEVRPECPLREIHVEYRRETMLRIPGCCPHRHGDRDCTFGCHFRLVDEGCPTRSMAVQMSSGLLISPDAEH